MLKSKACILVATLFISACNNNGDFFHRITASSNQDKIIFTDIHKLDLAIQSIAKTINNNGFSPILDVSISLTTNKDMHWPKAWVTLTVNTYIKNKIVSSMTKSELFEGNRHTVMFSQQVSEFELNPSDIKIEVLPVAWTPAYPLSVQEIKKYPVIDSKPN
jgi:hypothetical protein